MRTVLVEATPWDPATGAAVPVRLAGGGRLHYTHKGFSDWLAGVAALPKVTTALDFDDGGFGAGAIPQAAAVAFAPSQPGALERLARLVWTKAPVTISTGDDEAVPPVWTVSLAGTVAGYAIAGGTFSFTLSDMATPLSKPLAPLTFAGTGGVEGVAEAKGRVKRRSFGRVFNVEGRVLDKAANVFEFGDPARPIASFAAVRDRGRPGGLVIVPAQSTPAGTLAALVAAAAPQGGAAVAPSIACAKWWTVPAGPLTADLVGEVVGIRGDSVPEIAAAITDTLGGPAVTGLAAAIAARPQPAGLHVGDGSETAAAALDRLLLGASLAWAVEPAGGIRLRPLAFDAPVETIVADSVDRDRVLAPVLSVAVGYQKNERSHSDAEISAAVLAGDVVLDDGSSVAAAIGAIVSDSVLSRAEKPQVVIDRLALLADRDALQARYVALGSPADVTAARDAAFAKVQALDDYLTPLAPPWADASADTPIAAADYRTAWSAAHAAIATFAAAVTGRKGDQGLPGNNGNNGATLYTWVAYANSPDGSVDFTTDAPGGRRFRGEVVNAVTATESPTFSDYTWSPYAGPATFGLAGTNVSIGATGARKLGGAAGQYDAQVYSTEGWRGACQLSFRSGGLAALAAGINTDPTTDATQMSLDFAFDLTAGGAIRFRESGTLVTPSPALTYAAGDLFQLIYDGAKVRYLVNGVERRGVATSAGQLFYFDSSLSSASAALSAIAWSAMGAAGTTPVVVSAQPEAVQVQATSSGAAAAGQLPVAIGTLATQGGAPVAVTAVAIVSAAACSASVSGTGVQITALSGTAGEVVFDVTAAGQVVRKRVTYTLVQAGGSGGTSQTLALAAAVTSAAYAQNGGTFTLAAPAGGKVAANLTGSYKAPAGATIALQTKVQYRLGAGAWIDVAGSETTGSTSAYEDLSGGEPGAPTFTKQTAGGVASAGPYTLTGLTTGSLYEFRALARIASGSAAATDAVALRLYAEQAA